MGKHDPLNQPRTGDGRKNGVKPKKAQVAQRTKGGAVLWKLTAKLWGSGNGTKR